VRHKDDKKQQAICDAAVQLITAHGFADVSMSKIARAAGISPATIYVYFENKEELLNQVYLFVKREMSGALLRGLEPRMPVAESFKILWNNFYQYATANPVSFAFTEQFANSPLVERCRAQSLDFFNPLFALFERGKEEGVFKDISLEIFIAFTFSPLTGLIKEHLSGEIDLDEKALASVYEIAWDAVTN
jgi:TetR/AcrR family transcriptional regulator, multidrug resistance operon repressor